MRCAGRRLCAEASRGRRRSPEHRDRAFAAPFCRDILGQMPIRHTVQRGERLTAIAYRYGFKDHAAIYEHPDNSDLKQSRPNPNVLAAGDVWVIPDREPRELDLAVDRSHRVKVHRPKKELRIAFKDAAGEPV